MLMRPSAQWNPRTTSGFDTAGGASHGNRLAFRHCDLEEGAVAGTSTGCVTLTVAIRFVDSPHPVLEVADARRLYGSPTPAAPTICSAAVYPIDREHEALAQTVTEKRMQAAYKKEALR